MDIVVYNPRANSVAKRNIGSWARVNGCDFVVELHTNSFNNPQANGYETLKDFSQPLTNRFKALHSAVAGLGWKDRGIKPCNGGGGRYLQNPRLVRRVGIEYALLELGFISNDRDLKTLKDNTSKIPKVIVDSLKSSGVKKLGVVYGHGANDPGAVNKHGDREASLVRKLNFTNIKGEYLDMTKAELNKLLDERDNKLIQRIKEEIISPSTKGENKNHWAEKNHKSLKDKNIEIHDKRFNDLTKRGEMFAMLDRITDKSEKNN